LGISLLDDKEEDVDNGEGEGSVGLGNRSPSTLLKRQCFRGLR
jgi:hypothetical protein